MGSDIGAGELIAIVTAVCALITAIGAAVVNIIIAARTGSKVTEIAAKTDVVVAHVAAVQAQSEPPSQPLEVKVSPEAKPYGTDS
jgi:hypothetical protein